MIIEKLFSRVLTLGFILSLLVTAASAQTESTRPRQVTAPAQDAGAARVENAPEVVTEEPLIISLAETEEQKPARQFGIRPGMRFDQLLEAAIDARLGARYAYGAEGPGVFDCSGFVWSTFQSIGIHFDRGSARTFWLRFAPAREEEEFKFGTLVFFSNLTHIGIVADEHGFYHASRRYGVTYSPFSDYWLDRIDGFRRVPFPAQVSTE